MSSLNAFLHPVKLENKKIIVSKRFLDNEKPVQWEIRPITEAENNRLMKKYTRRDKKTGMEQFNRVEYGHALTAAAVVYPDLANAELQKAYGVVGETELLAAMLTAGEFNRLSNAVSELSDIDSTINDEVDEAKN